MSVLPVFACRLIARYFSEHELSLNSQHCQGGGQGQLYYLSKPVEGLKAVEIKKFRSLSLTGDGSPVRDDG